MPHTITLTIADADHVRVHKALCAAGGLDPATANIKTAIVAWMTATVGNVELSQAQSAAVAAIVAPVAPDIT